MVSIAHGIMTLLSTIVAFGYRRKLENALGIHAQVRQGSLSSKGSSDSLETKLKKMVQEADGEGKEFEERRKVARKKE
jgi:hypothetical protein